MEILYLNLIPGSIPPVCEATQNDVGRTIRFKLVDGFVPKILSGTETLKLRARKSNGSIETLSLTNSESDYVDVVTTQDLTDTPGFVYCKIRIDGIGTQSFKMRVEAQP